MKQLAASCLLISTLTLGCAQKPAGNAPAPAPSNPGGAAQPPATPKTAGKPITEDEARTAIMAYFAKPEIGEGKVTMLKLSGPIPPPDDLHSASYDDVIVYVVSHQSERPLGTSLIENRLMWIGRNQIKGQIEVAGEFANANLMKTYPPKAWMEKYKLQLPSMKKVDAK